MLSAISTEGEFKNRSHGDQIFCQYTVVDLSGDVINYLISQKRYVGCVILSDNVWNNHITNEENLCTLIWRWDMALDALINLYFSVFL